MHCTKRLPSSRRQSSQQFIRRGCSCLMWAPRWALRLRFRTSIGPKLDAAFRVLVPLFLLVSALLFLLAHLVADEHQPTFAVLAARHSWSPEEKAGYCRRAGRWYLLMSSAMWVYLNLHLLLGTSAPSPIGKSPGCSRLRMPHRPTLRSLLHRAALGIAQGATSTVRIVVKVFQCGALLLRVLASPQGLRALCRRSLMKWRERRSPVAGLPPGVRRVVSEPLLSNDSTSFQVTIVGTSPTDAEVREGLSPTSPSASSSSRRPLFISPLFSGTAAPPASPPLSPRTYRHFHTLSSSTTVWHNDIDRGGWKDAVIDASVASANKEREEWWE